MQYGVEEAEKLAVDVKQKGLGLFVMADWYDKKTMAKLRILDDNTHRHISPVTGGSNVPALNDLLRPFGIALGSGVLAGDWGFDRKSTRMVNGVPLIEFPSQVRVSRAPGMLLLFTPCCLQICNCLVALAGADSLGEGKGRDIQTLLDRSSICHHSWCRGQRGRLRRLQLRGLSAHRFGM
eukprot:COSAG02_NODE_4816_length_4942_cov_80.857526_5_plen_180_part_00